MGTSPPRTAGHLADVPHRHGAGLLQRVPVHSAAVFRALHLGDMLCAVPALRALRVALPQADIALVGLPWARAFAARFRAYVDEFIAFPGHPGLPEQPVRLDEVATFYDVMHGHGFDLALQMHGSGTVSNGVVAAFGARHRAGFRAEELAPVQDGIPFPAEGAEPGRLLQLTTALGAMPQGLELEFPLLRADYEELRHSGLGDKLRARRYLCVHPGARDRGKCWPPHCFAAVADRLAEEFQLQVVVTGAASEADLAQAVLRHMRQPARNAAAPVSIGAMAALMSEARLLVCNDTGVSHIAAGLGLPSVVIFSKADMGRWAPLDHSRHRSLWDPDGTRGHDVLAEARALLGAARR